MRPTGNAAARRFPYHATAARTASSARIPASVSHDSTSEKCSARWIWDAVKKLDAPRCGKCRSEGTLVRQSSDAATSQRPTAAANVAAHPMRVAVISDIHGNFHALETVLAALDGEETDALWCLGDLVGYGPLPNECAAAVAGRADLCLAGNHDLAVLGRVAIEDFSPDAAASAEWTRRVLSKDARSFLETLEPQAARDGVELFHGSPID